MFKSFFEGWYFKHQNHQETVSIIPGISKLHAFIQIITDDESYNIIFLKSQFKKDKDISIGDSTFSFNKITLNINKPDLIAQGEILYKNLISLNQDIMGPFRFLPLECRHGIISMYHNLQGELKINDKVFDFTNGIGYIEKDSGWSFPKRYSWVQSNDFQGRYSVMVAVADIPFMGFYFQGLICIIYYKDKEYRLTTYNGSKVIKCTQKKIEIASKSLKLEISISNYNSHTLYAPIHGKMTTIVKESPSCSARFKFFKKDTLIFDMESAKTSCEFVGY